MKHTLDYLINVMQCITLLQSKDMQTHLKDEIVGQQFNADVVLVGVRVGAGGAQGQLQQRLQPRRLHAVHVLSTIRGIKHN